MYNISLSGFGFQPQKCANFLLGIPIKDFFLCENLVLTRNSVKILPPVRILTEMQEEICFLVGSWGGQISWQDSCGYAWQKFFPGESNQENSGHFVTYFTRATHNLKSKH